MNDVESYINSGIIYSDFKESMRIIDSFAKKNEFTPLELAQLFKACTWIYKIDRIIDKQIKSEAIKRKELIKKHFSTISNYTKKLNTKAIIDNFEYIRQTNKIMCSWYMSLLLHFKAHNLIDDDCLYTLISKNYISVLGVIKCKELYEPHSKIIKKIFLEFPENFRFYIEKYDLNKKYYLPILSEKEMESIIDGFFTSIWAIPFYLDKMMLHRDKTSTYYLKREQRVNLPKIYQNALDNNVGSQKLYRINYNFTIVPNQADPLKIVRENNVTKYSISEDYVKKHSNEIEILKYFYNVLQVVDERCKITSIYKPNSEGFQSNLFNIKGPNDYGSDSFSNNMFIYVYVINLYISALEKNNLSLEKSINWFFSNYLPEKFNVNGFNVTLSDSKENLRNKNINIFATIEDLFKLYQIYVEEGKITPEYIGATLESVQIHKIKSLSKNKYYEINKNDKKFNYFLKLLFSDQSFLQFIPENKNVQQFLNFIANNEVNINMYNHKTGCKSDIFDLVKLGFLVIDEKGFIRLGSLEKIAIAYELFNDGFVSYYHLNEKGKKIIIEFEKSGHVLSNSFLFSSYEADYLSYCLKNEFSNGLGLRNKYLHGNSSMYNEIEHRKNYIIGLKLLMEIVLKIWDDLLIKKEIDK